MRHRIKKKYKYKNIINDIKNLIINKNIILNKKKSIVLERTFNKIFSKNKKKKGKYKNIRIEILKKKNIENLLNNIKKYYISRKINCIRTGDYSKTYIISFRSKL